MPFTQDELEEIRRQQAQQGQPVLPPAPPPVAAQPPLYQPYYPPTINSPKRRKMSLPPRVQADQAATQERLDLSRKDSERADAALVNATETAKRQQEEFDKRMTTLEANQGVDTQASQDAAAGHVVMLSHQIKAIRDATAIDPKANQPGWAETLSSGLDNQTITGFTQSEQRQVVHAATESAIESAIWLMTGAAAPIDQVKRISGGVTPLVSDEPATLRFKQKTMAAYLVQARARAGAANVKAQAALDELEEMLPMMYGEVTPPPEPDVVPKAAETPLAEPKGKIGSDVTRIKIPEAYQARHAAFLKKHPPGTLKFEDYQAFRKQQDTEFAEDFQGYGTDTKSIAAFVKAYNKGNATVRIPDIEVPISGMQKTVATALDSSGGALLANVANAASFGMGEALSGQEGRDKFHALNDEYPISSTVGDIAGSISPVKLAERFGAKAIEKYFPKIWADPTARQKILGQAATMAGYSGVRGFNSADEEEGLAEAGKSAAFGALSPYLGNLLVKGAKPFIANKTQEALSHLKGIKLSTMQKLGLGQTEESMRGLPLVHGERQRVMESMNTDQVSRALANVDEKIPAGVGPGFKLNDAMVKILETKYDKLKPRIVGNIDIPFTNTIAALRTKYANSPERKDLFKDITEALNLLGGKKYNGQSYRDTLDRLRLLKDTWAGKTATGGKTTVAEKDMAYVAGQMAKHIHKLIERQTPDVAKELVPLNQAWKHSIHILGASNRAARSEGIYTPGQYMDEIKGLDTSTRRNSVARGKAFDQDYANATLKVIGASPAGQLSPQEISMVTGLGMGAQKANVKLIPFFLKTAAIGLYGPGIKHLVRIVLTGERPIREKELDMLRVAFQEYSTQAVTGPEAPPAKPPSFEGR